MGGIAFLMLARMWAWGFEIYLYDHDVFVSCIILFVYNGCFGCFYCRDVCVRSRCCGFCLLIAFLRVVMIIMSLF